MAAVGDSICLHQRIKKLFPDPSQPPHYNMVKTAGGGGKGKKKVCAACLPHKLLMQPPNPPHLVAARPSAHPF